MQPCIWGLAGAPRRGPAGRRHPSELGVDDCRGLGYSPGPDRPHVGLEQLVGSVERAGLVVVVWSCWGG